MTRPPLTFEDIAPLLERLQGEDLVLIGGQALNIWCSVYAPTCPELRAFEPFVSKDVDYQASRAVVERCGRLLNTEPTLFDFGEPHSMTGVIDYSDERGVVCRIDFLERPAGLDQREVLQGAQGAPLRHSRELVVRVMNPFDCMRSRVHNVIDLAKKYANDHGLRQLNASILCVRETIAAIAARIDSRTAHKQNTRVAEFAETRVACTLFNRHRIDVLDALYLSDPPSENVLSEWLPRVQEKVCALRAKAPR